MNRFVACLRILPISLFAAAAFLWAWSPSAWAQHGGGGHAGGGHVGGGVHVGAPHVSAPATPHVMVSRPMVSYGPPPAARLIPPPGVTRPILGGHLLLPPSGGEAPHTIIGFPRTNGTGGSVIARFSGQGHEIWQDSVGFPRRPRFPGRPFFPITGPGFGFFGAPFFGFGLGFGFNSLWWPTCGPFWGWSYGCNSLPFYDYGLGYYSYGPGMYENPSENQPGPQIYENPSATSPFYTYGAEVRELVQLYLKDGTIYYVTDYWLVNDQLHFRTVEEGGTKSVEQVVDFDQLDLQKTIDINTQHGFRFVLRNEPLEQYLEDHPDNPSDAAPQTGPTGPLRPQEPQGQAPPQQP